MPPNPLACLCLPPRYSCSLCFCWMMKPLTACPASSVIHFKTSQAQINFLKNVIFRFFKICVQDEIHVAACYQNPSKIGMILCLLQAYPLQLHMATEHILHPNKMCIAVTSETGIMSTPVPFSSNI